MKDILGEVVRMLDGSAATSLALAVAASDDGYQRAWRRCRSPKKMAYILGHVDARAAARCAIRWVTAWIDAGPRAKAHPAILVDAAQYADGVETALFRAYCKEKRDAMDFLVVSTTKDVEWYVARAVTAACHAAAKLSNFDGPRSFFDPPANEVWCSVVTAAEYILMAHRNCDGAFDAARMADVVRELYPSGPDIDLLVRST